MSNLMLINSIQKARCFPRNKKTNFPNDRYDESSYCHLCFFLRLLMFLGYVFFLITNNSVAQEGTVYLNPSTTEWEFVTGVVDPSGVAYGFYNDSISESGM
jgi:hypothetical protein